MQDLTSKLFDRAQQRETRPCSDQIIEPYGMYTDVEVAENVDDDFLSALALLHSSDVNSAENLKQMLNASIEKKNIKTLKVHKNAHDKSKRKLNSRNYSSKAVSIVEEFEDQLKLLQKSTDEDFAKSSKEFQRDYNSISSSEIFSINVDETIEDAEIPRISIPDEATGDDIVCKICNGDRLGPLILLECQECQEIYHPLCHQPPVVDIDVYDPRLVWRCRKCIDTSDVKTLDAPLIVTVDNKIHSTKNYKRNIESFTSDFSYFRKTRVRQEIKENSIRKKSGFCEKNSTIQLRKRVGSKLSVTRAKSIGKTIDQ